MSCLAITCALLCAAPTPATAQTDAAASAELKALYDEDQAERTPPPGKSIDWSALILRDEARRLRAKALISADRLGSGADYYHAAMLMQHSHEVDDHLLAHDLCVIAISKGEPRAKWLAAASLDRFLVGIGRAQRFGTQSWSNHPSRPPKLRPVDPEVPDLLRRELGVPTLEEARAKERRLADSWAAPKPRN
jgi:hypothetical protein